MFSSVVFSSERFSTQRLLRLALVLSLVGLGASLNSSVLAQAYPSKPVKIIIPFPPGGTLDIVGRMLAQKLGEQTGQPFVVENRPGGNGTIGGDAVGKANADGYTLLFNASAFTTTPLAMKSPPYNVARDFTPIALVAKAPLSVAVNKDLPVSDIKGLFGYARANPGKLSFAIGSVASAGHLSTELLKQAGGIEYLVVPYKGSTPAYQDVIGGQISGFVDPVLGALNFYKSGMLKILAVTSASRLPMLPDVPTVAESIPGFEFYSWYGLWGPAKLSAEVLERLNLEVNKALAGDMREKLLGQGLLLGGGTAAAFARFQQEDIARSAKMIASANIRVD